MPPVPTPSGIKVPLHLRERPKKEKYIRVGVDTDGLLHIQGGITGSIRLDKAQVDWLIKKLTALQAAVEQDSEIEDS